ncbi:MAG: hypothetical protein WCI20_14720 [bacterium]
MKVPIIEDILDFLKLRLLPEVKTVQGDVECLRRDAKQTQDQLNQQDRVMSLILDEIREVKAEVRELRSYVFTSQMNSACYMVRDKPKS